MTRKRKLSNIKERCRICLVDNGCMSNLFEEPLQSKIKDLINCTSIDIKDEEELPSIICHVCFYKLEMWEEFKRQLFVSNRVLLGQLQLSEASENGTPQFKRSHSDAVHSTEDSLSDVPDKKKSKADMPSLIPLEFASVDCVDHKKLKEMYMSEDDPTSSKDSSQKVDDTVDSEKVAQKEENKNKECVQPRPTLVPMRIKPLTGRRGRITEKRKASTKRWVARKKALLAATGEEASDTDSVVSDDTQLSPVQKARAKSNADKEAERQKRLARAFKNLAHYPKDSQIKKRDSENAVSCTDSDSREIKSENESNTNTTCIDGKLSLAKDSDKSSLIEKPQLRSDSKEKENPSRASVEKDTTADSMKKDQTVIVEEPFTPCSVKSEIEIGDATYIVTSTLVLAEPNYINKPNLNSITKELQNGSIELNPQEKNTDIIDAVQLRRIHPVPIDPSEKKCVERCLNIEVEGTELEALKRVQVELAGFVEKEMKQRLFGRNTRSRLRQVTKTSYQTLDQQLKSIVEKAIKKNFESSMVRSCGTAFPLGQEKTRTVSPTFVKAAMNSKKYQPKVLVKRLDIAKESSQYKINNLHVLNQRSTVKNKLGGPFSMVAHKRQSVLPIRYNDYNTSALDSDTNISDESAVCEERKTVNVTESNASSAEKRKPDEPVPRIVGSAFTVGNSANLNDHKVDGYDNRKLDPSQCEKHTCGVCGKSFDSRNEVAAHVRTHKVDGAVVPRPNKIKMMRCKRCHEIVEARFVKAHVCKSVKQIYKCYVCNSTFRTEKLLVRHLDSHDQSEFSIEGITKGELKKQGNIGHSQNVKILSKLDKDQSLKLDSLSYHKVDNIRTSNGPSEKLIVKGSKSDNLRSGNKPKETYTCFVCDKMFTDEEVLKDHLQKHCDDPSEDEQSTGKELYQCAICGDSMDSEDALEAHVEKHLFDDEDDNPNLISIANENEKTKENLFQCLQCAETFSSEMLLEMHMQAHEEEAAIAEWEKQGTKAYEYQCRICDELFETEEELSEHLDVHNGNAHVCQLCEKPFRSLEDLQRHVATH